MDDFGNAPLIVSQVQPQFYDGLSDDMSYVYQSEGNYLPAAYSAQQLPRTHPVAYSSSFEVPDERISNIRPILSQQASTHDLFFHQSPHPSQMIAEMGYERGLQQEALESAINSRPLLNSLPNLISMEHQKRLAVLAQLEARLEDDKNEKLEEIVNQGKQMHQKLESMSSAIKKLTEAIAEVKESVKSSSIHQETIHTQLNTRHRTVALNGSRAISESEASYDLDKNVIDDPDTITVEPSERGELRKKRKIQNGSRK